MSFQHSNGASGATPVRVHMLSGLPPPYGGVNIWTQWFSERAAHYGIDVTVESVGPRGAADTLRPWSRLGRLMRGFIRPLVGITAGKARHADVLHVCASGGASFWRGLLLAGVRTAQRRRTVVHLHSRATRCHRPALALGRALSRGGLTTLVTPNRQDHRAWPFFEVIDHFVPPEFGPRQAWQGVSEGPLRLVYVGWMIREKGLFELLEAVRDLPSVQVDAFGPATRPADLRELLRSPCARFRYGGVLSHEEVARTTVRYDALVLPSHDESFGFAAAEAMHLGIPVIAPRVGFLWDAPDDVFVPFENVDASTIARVLRRVAADKAGCLTATAARGRAFVADRLHPERVMPRWRALYDA